MRWEFLDVQELREASQPGKGHLYKLAMWRTPVPGGWLLVALNTKSNDPQPIQSFYPDPEHVWTGRTPPEAGYLLRGASADTSPAVTGLLTPVIEDETELKRLER